MEAKRTPGQTVFYLGKPIEGDTIMAYCHGDPIDLAEDLTHAMCEAVGFAVIVQTAFRIWISRDRTGWGDRIEGALSKSEWNPCSKPLTTRSVSIREKHSFFFCVGRESRRSHVEGFFHGRPIDIANSLADAMSKKVELAAIVYWGWYNWEWDTKRGSREQIVMLEFDDQWMLPSRTVCTRFDSFYRKFYPEKTERILAWIEKVHKLLTDTDEFFKRGMPDFVWTEDEKEEVKYSGERAKSPSELEMKAFDKQVMNILWQKVLRMSKHRDDIWVRGPFETKLEWAKLKASGKLIDLQRTKKKRHSESDGEPPDLVA